MRWKCVHYVPLNWRRKKNLPYDLNLLDSLLRGILFAFALYKHRCTNAINYQWKNTGEAVYHRGF